MTTLNKTQALALATAVIRFRDDWGHPGVVAALERTATTADAYDIARALFALASDPTAKTPGLLAQPGPWWRKPDGTTPGRRGDHDQPCPVPGHNDQTAGTCRTCHAERDRDHPPPEFIAAIKAEVARAIADNPPPTPRRTGATP